MLLEKKIRLVFLLIVAYSFSNCRVQGTKAIDNRTQLKERYGRLKNADFAVKQAWIEDLGGDFSHLKKYYNISLDSAQASKMTLVPAKANLD